MSPVAGWYPDPAGEPGLERYWDGAAWTATTRPAVAPPPPPPPPPPTYEPVPPPPVADPAPGYDPAPAFDPGPTADAAPPPTAPPFDPAPAFDPGPTADAAPPPTAPPFDPAPAFDPGPTANAAPPPPPPFGAEPAPVPPPPAAAPPAGVAPVGGEPVSTPPPPPPAPSAAASMTGGPSVGGISTELLSDARFAEVQTGERVTRQNSRLLKITLGDDVLAKQGSMVAFQGQIDFDYEGSGASKFLKKAFTGEGVSLMRCSGQGELFLADSAHQVHLVRLSGAGLTVNGSNILAFEPTLNWDIERIKGAGMAAGGLFNTRLEGHGWVAITTDGDPVVLETDQPTFADTDAAVAWSSSLTTSLNRTVKAGALIGRGSGEAVQLAFQGQGIVIVQPSEGAVVAPHSH